MMSCNEQNSCHYNSNSDNPVSDTTESNATSRNVAVDIVLCIDTSKSMAEDNGSNQRRIDLVKERALRFPANFAALMRRTGKQISQLRVRLISFGDHLTNGAEALSATGFFMLPEQTDDFESFVNRLTVKDCDNNSYADGLEALAYAMNSRWLNCEKDYYRMIVLWTDTDTNEIRPGKAAVDHPEDMPERFSALTDLWTKLPNDSKNLLLFAPYFPWAEVSSNWNKVTHFTPEAGHSISVNDPLEPVSYNMKAPVRQPASESQSSEKGRMPASRENRGASMMDGMKAPCDSHFLFECCPGEATAAKPPCDIDKSGFYAAYGASDEHSIFDKGQQVPKMPDVRKVLFSAVVPKRLRKNRYTAIHILMYEKAFRKKVNTLIKNADYPVAETTTGVHEAEKGSAIKIRLLSPDLDIEDNEEIRIWSGDYLDFSFAVFVPDAFKKRQILFIALIYKDNVLLSKLKFCVSCSSFAKRVVKIARKDISSAFVSYASQDRNRVATIIQGMKKVRPEMDVFFDVERLRSGEDWEETLRHEIDKRDILFLCWSHYAKQSKWVEAEWRYALSTKGIDCIEPVPVERPICAPPEELNMKHFNDSLLYFVESDAW